MIRPLILMLSLLIACSACAEEVTLYARSVESDTTYFRVPREELEKIAEWDPADGKAAPLTRNQALEIARKAAAAEALELPDEAKLVIKLTKTNPFEKELVKRLPGDCCLWFYQIDFAGSSSKMESKYTFLVTMSGAVASKKIRARP